jgi:tRNA(Leu) C34 or U34 (ribose-2'-O)-methylase TrmL
MLTAKTLNDKSAMINICLWEVLGHFKISEDKFLKTAKSDQTEQIHIPRATLIQLYIIFGIEKESVLAFLNLNEKSYKTLLYFPHTKVYKRINLKETICIIENNIRNNTETNVCTN